MIEAQAGLSISNVNHLFQLHHGEGIQHVPCGRQTCPFGGGPGSIPRLSKVGLDDFSLSRY